LGFPEILKFFPDLSELDGPGSSVKTLEKLQKTLKNVSENPESQEKSSEFCNLIF
jgi:hypothetical protein